MFSFAPISAVLGASLLFDPVVSTRLFRSSWTKDLLLSAELGLDPDLLLNHRHVFHTLLLGAAEPGVSEEHVTIPIDHEDPSVGTYQNRYWVNEAYYTPGSPIFVYDGGESGADGSSTHLTSNASFFHSMLQEFKAMGIVWEHRYYGNSLPYPVNNDTPPEHFKYHTTKQALADLPYFAERFNRSSHPMVDLTPKSTPWVMVGGSYSGVRAAFTRNEYPETIHAAFASSAPAQARINMSSYYDQIYRGMVANGLGNCAKDLHAALQYIDGQLSRDDTAVSVKQLFLGDGAEKNSNGDFTVALGGAYGYFQTHGTGGGEGGLAELCRHLELDPKTNKTAGPNGFAPTHGNKYVAERWASFPAFTKVINLNMETNCRGLDTSTPASCVLNKLPMDSDSISWTWQYCSEWGFYQSNNVGAHSLLSRYQTLEFQQTQCNLQFPDALKSGILPSQPKTESLNREFGGWDIRPSNVYFSAGEFDPWRALSLLSNEEFAPRGVKYTTNVPKCNVPTGEGELFAYIGRNAVHCFDFQVGTAVGEESRKYFIGALKEWLPCFKKS